MKSGNIPLGGGQNNENASNGVSPVLQSLSERENIADEVIRAQPPEKKQNPKVLKNQSSTDAVVKGEQGILRGDTAKSSLKSTGGMKKQKSVIFKENEEGEEENNGSNNVVGLGDKFFEENQEK